MKYQVEKLQLEDPAITVLESLNKNVTIRRLLEVLAADWPEARKSINTLCHYVSQNIQNGGEPVLNMIIVNALKQYQRVVWHKNNEKFQDPLRIATFIDALISEACQALNIEVQAANGMKWTVHSGCAFTLWLSKNGGDVKVMPAENLDQKAIRKGLYELITEENIKSVLRRANYEAAIVDGSMPVAN